MSESTFTKDMTISEALEKNPAAARVFAMFNIGGCALCHMSAVETIEQGCAGHGVDADALIAELNKLDSN